MAKNSHKQRMLYVDFFFISTPLIAHGCKGINFSQKHSNILYNHNENNNEY